MYACAPSLTNVTYIVFNYLTLFPALVQYMRFGILPFIRWLFSDECRVFSAGTRKSTFVEGDCFSPFTVSVNVYFRLTHVFSVETLLCITLYHYISIHASS